MSRMDCRLRSVFTALAVAVLLGGVDSVAQAAPMDLLVSSNLTNNVKRYDGVTGAFLGDFVSAGPSGQLRPSGMALGPDGNLYVGSANGLDANVKRFNGATGAFIDTFTSVSLGAGDSINDITFGPDGNLYGSVGTQNSASGFVFRADGTTGALLGTIGAGIPSSGLAFGTDGNLYVGSYTTNQINRFNPTTGAFLDVFATVPIACSGCPVDITFGPDGNLYTGVNYSGATPTQIWRFNGTTGASLGSFTPAGDPHAFLPGIMAFGPDGNLYIPSGQTDEVLRYNGTTGAFIDSFASGGGLNFPWGLTFIPEPGTALLVMTGVLGLAASRRRRANETSLAPA